MTVFNFCYLLCSVALGCVLVGRTMIKALALSLIWYLGPALLLSQYSRNHLIETTNNYTFLFSSGNHFVKEMKNGTSPFFSGIDVSSLVAMAFSFLNILV